MDLCGKPLEVINNTAQQIISRAYKTFLSLTDLTGIYDIFLSDLVTIKMHMVLIFHFFLPFVLLSKGRPPPNMKPVQEDHVPMTAMPNRPYR